MFTFTHEQFSGPLDLLHQLIEEQKLPITEVALADITDQYIKYVETSGIDEAEMADFLLIAAKLLYLKSKELLPNLLPEEASGDDLARQLKMYERFVRAAEEVKEIILRHAYMYPREPVVIKQAGFWPPRALTAEKLHVTLQGIVARWRVVPLPEVAVQRTMSIKEKIEHVQTLLGKIKQAAFHDFIHDASSRHDIVVTFLALLELVKQRAVSLHQEQPFTNIQIHHTL